MLCDKCSNIHLKRLEEPHKIIDLLRKNGADPNEWLYYFHYQSPYEMRESARNGCHFCALVEYCLNQMSWYDTGLRPGSGPDGIAIHRLIPRERSITDLKHWHESSTLNIHRYEQFAQVTPSKLLPNEVPKSCFAPGIELTTDFFPNSPHLYISTTSPACVSLAYTWLKNCLDNHAPCTAFQSQGSLPSRIINVSDPKHPFIEDGESRDEQYVTLSYKWGEYIKYTTSKENIESHYTKISLEKLPKTFEQAIDITFKLGFRWLWIDALCILQDCAVEKHHEIAKMGEVYRCSTLTLFAECGDNANAGLSSIRNPLWVTPCEVTIKATFDEHELVSQMHAIGDLNSYNNQAAPLLRRGWVLQEEVLATRRLNFSEKMISWQCVCDKSTETNPRCRTKVEHPKTDEEWFEILCACSFGTLRHWMRVCNLSSLRDSNDQFYAWYLLVEEYSKRTLTYQSDILSALAGLAKELASTQNIDYTNGLWKNDLARGLLWSIKDDRRASRLPRPPVNKSLQDNNAKAPSWSWISQWGKEVSYQSPGWRANHLEILYRVIDDLDGNCCDLNKSFNDAQSLDSDHDVFQVVIKSSLTLTGHLTRILVLRHDPQHSIIRSDCFPSDYPWMKYIISPDTGERLHGFIALDTDYELVPLDEIYCLLCAVDITVDSHLFCLALRPTRGADNEYVRVGVVRARLDHPKARPEDVSQEGIGPFLQKYLPASPFWAKDGGESTIRLV